MGSRQLYPDSWFLKYSCIQTAGSFKTVVSRQFICARQHSCILTSVSRQLVPSRQLYPDSWFLQNSCIQTVYLCKSAQLYPDSWWVQDSCIQTADSFKTAVSRQLICARHHYCILKAGFVQDSTAVLYPYSWCDQDSCIQTAVS